MMSSLPPLALYVHVPWCVKKCPYCDFNSHAQKSVIPEKEFVAQLLLDLEQDLHRVWGRVVTSIFIGGGTPSLLSPAAISDLLAGCQARLKCAPDLEITMEGNPGSLLQQQAKAFRGAGVNRFSLGVQSFCDDSLRRIGRIHGADEARLAAESVVNAGFNSVNLDLMFGLPGQSVAGGLRDVAVACEMGAAHLSYYQLTLEPNTQFYRSPPPLPPEDEVLRLQQGAYDLLQEASYNQYEVSAFSRDGLQCRHNLNYWRYGDFLGIGPGAHAKLSSAQGVSRMSKLRHPKAYLAAAPADLRVGERTLGASDLVFEFALNSFRLKAGFRREQFVAATGLEWSAISTVLSAAEEKGLVCIGDDEVAATTLGWRFLNDLIEMFLADDPGSAQ